MKLFSIINRLNAIRRPNSLVSRLPSEKVPNKMANIMLNYQEIGFLVLFSYKKMSVMFL